MTPHMSPGTVLGGRYRLDDLLADHDGARFWLATDTVLARNVAVHAVRSDDARAADVLDAARLSATVTDPHFLRVLDCDDDGSLAWVINEWGNGVSLDLMLQRGVLPPSRAAWLAHEVAEAMAAAHDRGVHHGRLNPESVLVTDSGSVKVIGFVTNRAFEGGPSEHPAYGKLDAREADVIDLAGILYAALVGRWPGVAPSAVPPAPRDGQRPLRPRQVRAGIPRTLDAVCERVLHKEGLAHAMPIESAHEIAAALSDFVGDPSASAPLDVPSMHAEPTVTLPRPLESLQGLGTSGDPERTVAAPEPTRAIPQPPEPQAAPFEQPVDRPLFAEHDRRVPPGAPVLPPPPATQSQSTSTGSPLTSTGSTGTGGFWPFEPDDDTGSFSGREGRGWLKLAGILALVVVLLVAMFLAFNAGRKNDVGGKGKQSNGQTAGSTKLGTPIKVVSARDFDPEGDPPSENPEEARLAIDGDGSTGWQSMTYTRPNLGGLKSGVGLVLDLGADRSVGSVRVGFAGQPTRVELHATSAGVNDSPAVLSDAALVAKAQDAGESIVLRPTKGLRTRYLVIWLTSLPAADGGYRGEITGVTVRS